MALSQKSGTSSPSAKSLIMQFSEIAGKLKISSEDPSLFQVISTVQSFSHTEIGQNTALNEQATLSSIFGNSLCT